MSFDLHLYKSAAAKQSIIKARSRSKNQSLFGDMGCSYDNSWSDARRISYLTGATGTTVSSVTISVSLTRLMHTNSFKLSQEVFERRFSWQFLVF